MDNLKTLISIVMEKELQNTGLQIVYFLEDGETINNYEPYNTLIDFYSNIQNDYNKKEEFVNCLLDNILNNETISYDICIGNAHLAVYTLIKLGFTKKVLEVLRSRTFATFLIPVVLNVLCKEKFKYFDDSEISEIKNFLIRQIGALDQFDSSSTLSNVIKKYVKTLIDLRYENLKKSIKSVNLEINLDKKIVNEKLGFLGFDSKFTGLLDEIDIYINTDTSRYVNAAMIGNLRVFMGDIFKDIANKISNQLNEAIPKLEGRGEMGNLREYIKNKLELHENEDKFINNFINILHTEGGHSFTSEKEYFRLSRNIAIEIALLLLSKYEKKSACNDKSIKNE